jgi:hypothetical protein
VKEIKDSLLHFVFPSHCLHCQEEEVGQTFLFCVDCRELIELFSIDHCLPYKAVAVEKEGAVLSLLRERNGSLQKEIISTMAAFMVFQMLKLKWPLPDRILSSPLDPINRMLSKIISSWFDIPFSDWIRSENVWTPKICSDELLLVVDCFLSFSTSWDLLQEGAPSQVFIIGFCQKDP